MPLRAGKHVFQRESATPIDLASFHSTEKVNCIDCHSGVGLIPGRVDSFLLGTKDLIAWQTGQASNRRSTPSRSMM